MGHTQTFERSQARHQPNQQFSPRNLKEEHWLLRRLVRCEKCRLKCTCITDNKNPLRRPPAHYYRCANQERLMGRPRCRPNHVRSKPLDDLVWQEVCRHLQRPELLLQVQSATDDSRSLDQYVLSCQLENAKKRLTQAQGERHRLIDAFQSGYIEKSEFEERARKVSDRVNTLKGDVTALEHEEQNASSKNELLARLTHSTSAITGKLERMTFKDKQALVRTVLREVGVDGNTVKLYFNIPLPQLEKKTLNRTNASPENAVSTKFVLRSRCAAAGCSRRGCREKEGLPSPGKPPETRAADR